MILLARMRGTCQPSANRAEGALNTNPQGHKTETVFTEQETNRSEILLTRTYTQ
jgi:hypothetical protein